MKKTIVITSIILAIVISAPANNIFGNRISNIINGLFGNKNSDDSGGLFGIRNSESSIFTPTTNDTSNSETYQSYPLTQTYQHGHLYEHDQISGDIFKDGRKIYDNSSR